MSFTSDGFQYVLTVHLILYPQALVLRRLIVDVLRTMGLGLYVHGCKCVCVCEVLELPADMLQSGELV